MIRFYTAILLLALLLCNKAYSQGENNVWCFGRYTGMDFNSTTPAFFQHNMQVNEGCASVCDAAGNLLFYSSGFSNWDRNGNLMPNGAGMSGNGPSTPGSNMGSSQKGVAIVPSPANPLQYYMITTNSGEDVEHNAYYSVIDMSLNGGLGDVVPGLKNIVLDTGVSEGVLVQRAATCGDYWIILHQGPSTRHLSYKLDATGIHPPVASNGILWPLGYTTFNEAGTLSVAGFSDMEVLSFDKATGLFSLLGWLYNYPAGGRNVAFSPDGTRLYAGSGFLVQYDMSLLPNIAAVQSARVLIDTGALIHLRLGPDHKIYVLRSYSGKLGCISNPNATGSACLYDRDAFTLPVYSPWPYGELGNPVPVHRPDTLPGLVTDTIICQLPQLRLKAAGQHQAYLWNTGSTNSETTVYEDGTYWVYGSDPCALSIDSFHIRFTRFDTGLPPDTILCAGKELLLDATTNGAAYLWQDGSTAATYAVGDQGDYYVKTTVGPCVRTDTVRVRVVTPYARIEAQDTAICSGTALVLHAESNPAGSYQWNNGGNGPAITVNQAGTYTVTASTICGPLQDSVRIAVQNCNCRAYTPNAFSPNGDGLNDRFVIELHCPFVTAYKHTIYNRYGQMVFESLQPDRFWDGRFNGLACDAGTYFYYIEYKNGEEKMKKKGELVLIR